MHRSFEHDVQDAIGRAYPQLSKEELSSAVEAFRGYVEIVNDIHAGLLDDPERSAAAATLTAGLSHATVEAGQVRPTSQQTPPLDA